MIIAQDWPSGQDRGPAAPPSGLNKGEHLLVSSWRRVGAGQGDCPLIARAFVEACGEDAAEVFATFCGFLRALAYASRGRVRIAHPGCVGLTLDERRLLSLIAAAQGGDRACFEAHLRWLARIELRAVLAIAVGALGTALALHNLNLPLPSPACGAVEQGRRRGGIALLTAS
jgi:hypothetical protein